MTNCVPTCMWLALLLALIPLTGCGKYSDALDCSGPGETRGSYKNVNDGELDFEHGLAWRNGGGGYTILFTRDTVLAEALRLSPEPDWESARIGELLRELLVGFQFHPDGKYHQRITLGTSTSSGWSGADKGSIKLDSDGCLRGDVVLDYYGAGHFALPLIEPPPTGSTAVEYDPRPERDTARPPQSPEPDALTEWSRTWTRLQSAHPVIALQTLGFSSAVATRLVDDKRALAALARVRGQCPEPATARIGEYGDIEGPANPKPGMVMNATGDTEVSPLGETFIKCYVMQRDGEYIDQCWPLTTDCTTTPLYKPSS
jgi:hypothetical protein